MDFDRRDAPLPVVLVTDPGWAFPIVRSIRNLTGRSGRNIEDFILVGITHDPTLTPAQSRARDYTPTDPRRSAAHDASEASSLEMFASSPQGLPAS